MRQPTVDVVLTRFRRNTLKWQFRGIESQTLRPASVTVFQNTNYLKPMPRRYARRGHQSVLNSANTFHFGRFAFALNLQSDYIAVLDDDIIPGKSCLASFVSQAQEFDAIIGANGRIADRNPQRAKLHQPPDVGIRAEPVVVDFVGHMWVFRREVLFEMFGVRPFTMLTGEDMHLCFSAKLRNATRAIVGAQVTRDELSDTAMNRLAVDQHASHLQPQHSLRPEIEAYFENLGLQFVAHNALHS